jgi:hypothetical protein
MNSYAEMKKAKQEYKDRKIGRTMTLIALVMICSTLGKWTMSFWIPFSVMAILIFFMSFKKTAFITTMVTGASWIFLGWFSLIGEIIDSWWIKAIVLLVMSIVTILTQLIWLDFNKGKIF